MTVLQDILQNFQFERKLSQDSRSKLVHILGKVNGKDCILSIEKLPFEDEALSTFGQSIAQLDKQVDNNIYGWGYGHYDLAVLDTKIKYIYPATELHIKKYEEQAKVMIIETPKVYQQVTKPYIDSIPSSRIDWVHNILKGEAEVDHVIYHDHDPTQGFVILPDMKWDGNTISSLYLVAIFMDPTLLSIRSLTPTHLPLLKQFQSTCYQLVKEKYGLNPHQLRLFFHYQPSYYHLHIHITSLSMVDPPGALVGQAHLLDTVISNLELYPTYYQQATLSFVIGERHPLYSNYTKWIQSE
ncbi:HIT-like domain-containing protein [Cunninghamella echinulata]|nr:HIT-like domain-containing protein [Cunninghamella echinulata]